MNEFRHNTGGFHIDQIEDAKSLANHRRFIRDNNRIRIGNWDQRSVGVDLDNTLNHSDGFFRRNKRQGFIKAHHLVAVIGKPFDFAEKREAFRAGRAAGSEDFHCLSIHGNDAVIIEQEGTFDNANGILPGNRLGDHDR